MHDVRIVNPLSVPRGKRRFLVILLIDFYLPISLLKVELCVKPTINYLVKYLLNILHGIDYESFSSLVYEFSTKAMSSLFFIVNFTVVLHVLVLDLMIPALSILSISKSACFYKEDGMRMPQATKV
ncbi:hypothetical protein RF11_12061 [Thelohanellus kitauei]|uniref:Uncharacterized protein n=1 Tax=Thelohanellus kitauei TaxID=669202 RepID=A0A0C2MNI0_THEKT|nr:hypothetical protein RF11_12061 [Thelohanellus kitauei]